MGHNKSLSCVDSVQFYTVSLVCKAFNNACRVA